ncbi:portal protein [Xanthobacter flavus]|uniref:portal protein n=1 Tax=Xanthobacter flavus TaxID=281 RepID=UPI00372C0CAA
MAPRSGPLKAISEEANERLSDCRKQKDMWRLDLEEAYFFAAPPRARELNSNTQPAATKPHDESELQTSLGFECAEDFGTLVCDTFMPQTQRWAERAKGALIDQDTWDNIKDDVKDGDGAIFDGIGASNFYPELAKGVNPDASTGTLAIWIDMGRPGQPIWCQSVPLRELEINIGPTGDIDDRFIVRHTTYGKLPALLPADIMAKLPKVIADKVRKDRRGKIVVRWGYWRVWEERGDEVWQHVVMVGEDVVHEVRLVGEGSCPLVVGRFGAFAEWAFGWGPILRALPDLRQLDEQRALFIDSLDGMIRPPMGYPDDQMSNLEGGVEAGMFYPVRPGTEGAIKPLYEQPKPDAALFEEANLERRIKRLFYQDFPEQRGDTPPTATQWAEEVKRALRRIGTPGLVFWREFCGGVFLRFKYLLEKAGKVTPVQVNGAAVSLTPINPAQREQDALEVAAFGSFVATAGAAFPEEFKVHVDGAETMKKLCDKLGANKIVTWRSDDDIKSAIGQISQLSGAQAPAAAPGMAPAAGM